MSREGIILALTQAKATEMAEKLIEAAVWFSVEPLPKDQWEFSFWEEDRAAIEKLLVGGPTIIFYNGQSVRCYGKMHPEQNVWWATEDEEGIFPNGFETWRDAVKYFIDQDIQVVELSGV